MADTEIQQPALQQQEVVYCEVCTLPPEYCEFGSSLAKCQQWLKEHHEDLFEQLYGDAQANARDEQAANRVVIKRIERNRRKHVTSIFGLHLFDVDMKKAAKLFANKFACGSSVTKNNQGKDEIVVQGDVTDDVRDLILATWPAVTEDAIETVIEEKKKGKNPPLPPPQ
ncbi:translation initiation factor SUI1 [Syncephalis pseudoplumigaleata]|uniref:Translation machinery-associated protein 22 n=1 Tax=Syncephalis pseudoplumigaleata TaxID=1712513 RepID=A0A4P9YR68_9FUNG|nr:translation initiation factor SUI1 [Syncephalis pseudoplumigaleata]|eukprot:RKP22336.1 translation initiation factor SUI1 [Syncephalis pseudoplumigaleata]